MIQYQIFPFLARNSGQAFESLHLLYMGKRGAVMDGYQRDSAQLSLPTHSYSMMPPAEAPGKSILGRGIETGDHWIVWNALQLAIQKYGHEGLIAAPPPFRTVTRPHGTYVASTK